MTLYEINEAITNFEYDIDPETGEILNAADLDNLEMERDEKIENLALWVKDMRKDQKGILEEVANQKDRAERLGRKADSIERYIDMQLQGKPFRTTKCEVSYRKSKRVDIINDMLIPDIYCKYETKRTPDKTRIRKAIDSGEDIQGAKLIERNNISIK